MKTKTTTRELKESGALIVSIPDGLDLKYLDDPRWYNCGVYGWNFDAFESRACILVQGYRYPKSLYNYKTPYNEASAIISKYKEELKAFNDWDNYQAKRWELFEKCAAELLEAAKEGNK